MFVISLLSCFVYCKHYFLTRLNQLIGLRISQDIRLDRGFE